ncbi:DUF1493 family protein [[Limnothrix rosea] IAM M-220]|uniref:DUF1493 family protein n=1 Tax=[Limnothrix rosea] IAM M-220 TaxID=454133 RepID=UPI000968ACA6|nr:DUF1493 family protein [[Limnothrix rosea] IAM M-220]OKH18113.1 hypothetical protein NIES208_07155 [[Limnothrix rosea] IAM M-220]
MVAIAEVYRFIQTELEVSETLLNPDTDLFQTFDLQADACNDFMKSFGEEFKVDLDNYLWYFHHGEAGLNIGGFIFAPPYRRVERLAITPEILQKAATKKRWKLQYPDHDIPKKRWDMVINKAILFFVFFYSLNRFAPLLIDRFLG